MNSTPTFALVSSALTTLAILTPASADPTIQRITETEQLSDMVQTHVTYPRLGGLPADVAARINTGLREAAFAPGLKVMDRMGDVEELADVVVRETLISDRLAAFEILTSVNHFGFYTNESQDTVIFDLRSGQPIPGLELFKPDALGAVHTQVVRALRGAYREEDGHSLTDPEAGDLGRVAPTPSGIGFYWNENELNASNVTGPPQVVVPYGCLAGMLNEDLLGALAQANADCGLPGGPTLPDADYMDPATPSGAYLDRLAGLAQQRLSALPFDTRAAMREDGRWREAYPGDGFVAAFASMGEPEVSDRIRAVLDQARGQAQAAGFTEFGSVADEETTILRSTLERALQTMTGRVVTQGGPLQVRAVEASGWGQPIAELNAGDVVAVLEPAPDGELFHVVQLPSGDRGHVHRFYVLLEEVRVGLEGQVNEVEGGTLLFVSGGEVVELIGMDGPDRPDAQMDRLRSLLGPSGASEPLVLDVVERRIGERRWFAPRSSTTQAEAAAAASVGSDRLGVTDALGR